VAKISNEARKDTTFNLSFSNKSLPSQFESYALGKIRQTTAFLIFFTRSKPSFIPTDFLHLGVDVSCNVKGIKSDTSIGLYLQKMNVKSILVLLFSGGFFLFCHYWYCCQVKAACYGCADSKEAMAAVAAGVEPETQAPLLFEWNNASAIVRSSFGEEKSKWLSEKSDDNLLQITGLYYDQEEAPAGFQNMGLARADAVRKLLILELPDERIRLSSEQRKKEMTTGRAPFEGIEMRWIPSSENIANVIDFGQKAIILFPNNSYIKESNQETDRFLKLVAERVKSSGETIFLTGHADNTGNYESNLRLAEKRAMRIRRILRLMGVPRQQIVANSKGDQEPVASNETEGGRYLNRRVVLEIKSTNL
jgi:OmpA-OmpF porin, OOP family